ncbi:hypothetical protein [Nannocystis sp. SCPEA4]|uniref:hypothetical protein n=1 Tax=Nannocystis sp. SCPEA4 TaxID=2996787 RepID=UPI002271CAA0|nr:hypothetical protein [Nannocystis sp. SCPEA4]MCY1055430.1 hypothetical protein [Nannocystis sp. SCPEA4]
MTWPFLPTGPAFKDWPEQTQADYSRKWSALRRLRILQEDFRDSIVARIHETHAQPEVRERISKFASVAVNPARDITSSVAMAYDNGVRRILRGASEEAQAAFTTLVNESLASTKAPYWNKYSFFLGPTLVIPVVRKGKLKLDLIRPEVCDVKLDPEDPMGLPIAAAWSAHGGDSAFVMLDQEAWRYLDPQGRDVKPPQPHNLKYWPGSVFRLDEPVDCWWPRNYQERLVDATVQAAYTYAKLCWVRKSQNKKLLTVVGQTEEMPRGQVLDPELALTISSDAQATTVQVSDFDTDPKNFLAEIRFVLETIIESYGIPQSAVTYDVGQEGGPLAISIKKERLGSLRAAQIPFLDRGEHELWPAAVAIARVAGHPLASKLPPPDEVKEMLDVQWPRLRVIDNPLEREALYKEQLKRGGVSPVDMIQEDHPELTREECIDLMKQNLADYAALSEELAARNLVMDLANGVIASSEAFGRLGPQVRDQQPPTPPAPASEAEPDEEE